MRKFWKILGITLCSLVGLVVIVVSLLVYVIFTPSRLTPLVTNVADDYIRCDYRLGKVDLTFFSTFPEFGLRADSLLIINPVYGAQSDTLLAAKRVVARLDVKQLLDGNVNIHELALQDVIANAYIGVDTTNFDILSLPTDTTPEDSSESFIKSISFTDMQVVLDGKLLSLYDERDTIFARMEDAHVRFSAKQENELVKGLLDIDLPAISAHYKGVDYVSDANIRLKLPYDLLLEMPSIDSIHSASMTLHNASVAMNQFEVNLSGDMSVIPEVNLCIDLKTNKIRVSELLAIVPPSIFQLPDDIRADATVRLSAHIAGLYDSIHWPVIDAHLSCNNAEGSIASLPYVLTNVEGNADIHLELDNEPQCYAVVHQLYAETKKSSVSISGRLDDLLNSMLLDLLLDVDLHLPDVQYFLPDNITADGHAKGSLAAKISLADLADVRLEKGVIDADLALKNFRATYDSLLVSSPKGNLTFHVPNNKAASSSDKLALARRKKLDFLSGSLTLSQLNAEEEGQLTAALGATSLDIQLSNILSDDAVICADVDLSTTDLHALLNMNDSSGRAIPASITTAQPNIKAFVEYDTQDSTRIPTLACQFGMDRLAIAYDTITAHLCHPSGDASLTGGRRDQTQPRLRASLTADDVDAKMGTLADASSGKMALKIAAAHTNNKENFLLEWRPRLDFNLNKAVAHVQGLAPEIRIPACKFSYSNRDFHIDTARVELSHSDFSLSGDVHHIGAWLENKAMLTGEMNFTSTYADITELLSFISGMGSDEEPEALEEHEPSESQDNTSVFIVPKGVDFTLRTNIQRASAFDQQLRDLGGMVYIRDGVMVIEEMGFICDAAQLQLTALYKTPRRNHIFAGFDYHMTHIDVEELVNMIPQVDSMLPMLRSFKGAANFHVAAETYLNDQYELKYSTTRGALSIDAKDLTLLDGEVFTKIAKILTFKKKTENKIDSISAEIALYKNEIDIYPFMISCDKWMGAVGGRHQLDGTMDYNINLLSPLYLGVNVKGNLNDFEKLSDLSIRPAKCVYAKDFRPVFRGEVDTRAADIRKMIKAALEKNLKE